MIYLGDFPADQAIYFMWNTNDQLGESVTRSVDGTISVYKDASNGTAFDLTQVTTGITNDEDVDTLTGVHSCCIVTTDAWYETGHDYVVVLSAATIDGATMNAVIAHFSIENRHMVGTDSALTDKTGFALSDAGIDGILDENIEGTHTFREMLRLLAAATVGKSSGGGTTTVTFRDIDDTKDRIVATVTSVGNRTAMNLTEA